MNHHLNWVPWFSELAKKISDESKSNLIEKSKKIDWKSGSALLDYGDKNIDPFSFFYFLAQKNGSDIFKDVCKSIHDVFDLKADCPTSRISIPNPPFVAKVLFHDGKVFKPELLWKLFRQAADDKQAISPEYFEKVLKIPNVGVIKLTQSLFLINPKRFLPTDKQITPVMSNGLLSLNFAAIEKSIFSDGYKQYEAIANEIREYFPECSPYEIQLFLYLHSKETLITKTMKIYQVSSNVFDDHWELNESHSNNRLTFKENYCIYTSDEVFPVTEPVRGDVILVRTGMQQGRGIGVVDENEYTIEGKKNPVIRVFWINKYSSELSFEHTPAKTGFSATSTALETYFAFRKCEAYQPSFKLIRSFSGVRKLSSRVVVEKDVSNGDGIEDHPLNSILYGPSGTGKTYETAERCVNICYGPTPRSRDDINHLYNKLKTDRRVEFITFHQSYSYEEFVEGLRPETKPPKGGDTSEAGFRLEPKDGVFKRIAKRARNSEDNNQRYVLIIDEINRANISKVLGELVTLLEEDKRLGAKNEVVVTLPYSQEQFRLPANLFIVGTMNTADRSIALLDTALRRRFEFEEIPPKPDLLKSAEQKTGIDLPEMLRMINRRIEWFIDRDHLIGHALFMNASEKSDVDRIMRSKIIPLLAEYFYDDWDKVCAVLGGGEDFVKKSKLKLPPGVVDASDDRYRWTVRDEFSEEAYKRLISGLARPADDEGQ